MGLANFSAEDPNAKKKKNKKNAAKSRVQLWTDLFKKTKLEPEDIEILKDDLVLRGVESVRINPNASWSSLASTSLLRLHLDYD